MKTKIQFPHKEFLKQNAEVLADHPIPELLHRRIIGFAELELDLEQTSEEDRDQLLIKLEALSHELDEELEDYFEDFLENNELEETDEPEQIADAEQSLPAPSTGTPEAITLMESNETRDTETSNLSAEQVEEREVLSASVEDAVTTDEQILEKFLLEGKQQVLPGDLIKKGFKAPFNGRKIGVGKFLLQKKRYDVHYRILLQL